MVPNGEFHQQIAEIYSYVKLHTLDYKELYAWMLCLWLFPSLAPNLSNIFMDVYVWVYKCLWLSVCMSVQVSARVCVCVRPFLS